jgi:hypothetical protein
MRKKDGIGIINIKKRGQLIGAEINFESEKRERHREYEKGMETIYSS